MMPTIIPGTIMFQTMVIHIPTPKTTVAKTPKSVVAIALPLKTITGLPSILRRTRTIASNTATPTMPITMPCVIAPHSGNNAMHIPRANRMPPITLIIKVTKSFFFIVDYLHDFFVISHLLIVFYIPDVYKTFKLCFRNIKKKNLPNSLKQRRKYFFYLVGNAVLFGKYHRTIYRVVISLSKMLLLQADRPQNITRISATPINAVKVSLLLPFLHLVLAQNRIVTLKALSGSTAVWIASAIPPLTGNVIKIRKYEFMNRYENLTYLFSF